MGIGEWLWKGIDIADISEVLFIRSSSLTGITSYIAYTLFYKAVFAYKH